MANIKVEFPMAFQEDVLDSQVTSMLFDLYIKENKY